ncbi:MAG TPA: arginine deiminase family protein [Gemmatimonadaceae bacterium]|nr:arginine deiminase family protein [Gemmatimonadaceae bacterium]
MLTAITRPPSTRLPECELSHMERQPIDVTAARAQHAAYRAALAAAGAEVICLPRLDDLPDATFVEDTAIVLDTVAVMAEMGAPSRRRESAEIAGTLARWRSVRTLATPATLDGGDVLHLGHTLYVGETPRTNAEAHAQLSALVEPLGYTVVSVPVTACLHLKSACAALSDETVLVNPEWVEPAVFTGAKVIAIAPAEQWGANAVRVGETIILPASAPGTRDKVSASGFRTVLVDVSEFQKAEAGVSCLSLLIDV